MFVNQNSCGLPSHFCLRQDVDGFVWRVEPKSGDNLEPFCHAATFNAFGYVKASKTMAKFTSAPTGKLRSKKITAGKLRSKKKFTAGKLLSKKITAGKLHSKKITADKLRSKKNLLQVNFAAKKLPQLNYAAKKLPQVNYAAKKF